MTIEYAIWEIQSVWLDITLKSMESKHKTHNKSNSLPLK